MPTGHLQQLAGGADLAAFLQLRVVAEDDDADLGLVEVQREAGDAVAEVEHLVEHHVAEPLDACDAVADLADRRRRVCRAAAAFDARDLRFEFLNAGRPSNRLTSRCSEARCRAPPAGRARCRRRRRCRP